MAAIGTLVGDRLELDKAALAAAIQEAMPKPAPAPEPTAHHQGMRWGGFAPEMSEIRDAAIGGLYAVVGAKAIAKVLPVVSHPVAADYIAWIILSKWGNKLPGLDGGAREAARTVLLVDALRGMAPTVENTLTGLLSNLPSFGPATPLTIPTLGTLGGVAAMRQDDFRGNQGGGSLVVNRLAVTNI